MIKLSNIAAAWAALRGTTDSLQEDTQRRIHDFLDFVDPEHETARRILRHLHSSILCNDYGATTFCLRALFEGMTNLFLNEEMGESKIQEWFPDKIVNDSPATSILKNWLEQKNMNSPDCIATINGSMFLSIEL